MKLLIISSAPIVQQNNKYYLYGPYEKEMQIWAKFSSSIQFCCPVWNEDRNLLISEISFPIGKTIELLDFDLTSFTNGLKAIPKVLYNFFILLKAMHKADHIHLRCPGNTALLGSIAQIFYPKKIKTAKYAGNWAPKSKQPFSYRMQKSILSNTFLTKNMQVLVYGEWENSTKNIKSFFTATYTETDKKEVEIRDLKATINFMFVGMLSKGKQPLYAAKLIRELIVKGYKVNLKYFGEGALKEELVQFIENNKLQEVITLQGNQSKEVIKDAYQESHFLVLPSKSEGWPKVVAEAMFWGCVPLVSGVSCVPYMVNKGERGVLLTENKAKDLYKLESLISNQRSYEKMAQSAMLWSRQFTTDKFEEEIQKVLFGI